MTDRLNKIFFELPVCAVFADIGCDHGYVAKAMLHSSKCEHAIVSDISEKCLEKAISLLDEEIKDGRATAVVSDGFDNLSSCDCALIAGMGGEEIVSILKKAKELPEVLVLQPMKNCDKVRRCVLSCGYQFKKDFVFKSAGKYYDLIVLYKGEDSLTEEEIEFGRDNVQFLPKAFVQLMEENLNKIQAFLGNENLSKGVRLEMEERAEKIRKYVKD